MGIDRIRWAMLSRSIFTSGVLAAVGAVGFGFGAAGFDSSAGFSSSLSGANGEGSVFDKTTR
jgi:hypothetical protein